MLNQRVVVGLQQHITQISTLLSTSGLNNNTYLFRPFKDATSMIDRAKAKGILHARNASRRVSRLAHLAATKLK